MASEVLVNITKEDIEWARQLSEEKRILDYQSDRESDRREAREEGLKEVAKKLKENGVSLEIIAQSTGLSPEEIAGL